MKKSILYLIFSFLLISGFTQSLELYFEDELVESGEELTFTAHADSGMMSFEGLEVLNKSLNPLNIKCAREIITEVLNTENSFCWGVCYSTSTDTSTVSVKIDAGVFSNEFIGDYLPQGFAGITTVKYIFYDIANPDDHIHFILNYKATSESDVKLGEVAVYLSPVYPNPANNEVNLDFTFDQKNSAVKFVLYNLFGENVKDIEISELTGSLKLNTSDLTEGIYFYSLVINNEPTLTQKLVIQH